MNSYKELVLNSNLPNFNEFNFIRNVSQNNYRNNIVNYPNNTYYPNTMPVIEYSPPAPVRRYDPWQVSIIKNSNARRNRLAKMELALSQPNRNIRVKHRRTPQQLRNNTVKAIKDPYMRIRHEISNEPSYLPNIRKNLTKKHMRRASPLKPKKNK